jgi:tetrahydromethanopterin S-methyltransferase subunit B
MKLLNWLKAKWAKWFGPDKRLLNDVKKVIAVLKAVRETINNPALDAFTAAIPGNIDDRIVDAVRRALDHILKLEDAVNNFPTEISTNETLLNAVLHKTASTAVAYIGKLKEAEADTLVQVVYHDLKNAA